MGGMLHGLTRPIRRLTLGREAAREIDAAGSEAAFLYVDDRGVITSRTRPSGDIDLSGAYGGVASYLLMETASAGRDAARCWRNGAGAISHRFVIYEVHDAFQLARGAGAAENVVVAFDD
jgi:NADPH:quinone reductase-like Zn-dependent oxidoreductase